MGEQHDRSLYERVERLEQVVEELQRTLTQLRPGDDLPAVSSEPVARPSPEPLKQPSPAPESSDPSDDIRTSESWLNKIGIGLLLFGVVFLFKYSIDQGWITPSIRVGFGLVLGVGLLVVGVRTYAGRRHFSQVLLGGGIATFYISGFAAFQLYALVSHPFAFAFMVSVTALAFILSLRQDEAVLSLIGAAGGLGTPFLLYTGAGSLAGLVGYTCLVLSGTSAIYVFRGWRSLLWTSVIGGWAVFLIGYNQGIAHWRALPTSIDRWALQLGIIFGWLAFWALPVVREILRAGNPARWTQSSLNLLGEPVSKQVEAFVNRHVHLLTVITPLLVLALSIGIWSLSEETAGWITVVGVLFYGLISWYLRRKEGGKPFAYTHTLVASLLLTIAFCLLLDGDTLFFTLAAEATALHFLACRLSDRVTAIGAHLIFLVLGVWLVVRLVSMKVEGIAILNAQALTDLAVIAAGIVVSRVLQSREAVQVYRLIGHLSILVWLWRELYTLPNGMGYITIAWGIYAVALLVSGLRLNLNQFRLAGMGTLVLVIGKLFLIDLARVEAIWRILLFLGFGGLFLLLSYYFQALWKPGSAPGDKST